MPKETMCAAAAKPQAQMQPPAHAGAIVRLGELRFSAGDLARSCSWGLCLAYVWLVFGFGLCDQVDVGKGYLQSAVLFAKAAVLVLVCVLASSNRVFDAATRSTSAAWVAGLVCVVTSAPLVTAVQVSASEPVLAALSAISSAAASLCCIISARSVLMCRGPVQLVASMHVGLIVLCLACFAVMSLHSYASAVLFSLLPLASALLALRSNACDEAALAAEEATYSGPTMLDWASADCCPHASKSGEDGSDAQSAASHAALRGQLACLMATLFAFCVDIALVRSQGLDLLGGAEGHSNGALLSVTLLALLGVAVTALLSRGSRPALMRTWYALSCLAMCFAALVLVLTSVNDTAVRVVENIAYFLFVFAMIYALAVAVHHGHASVRLALCVPLGVASVGIACGWILQNAVLAPEDSNAFAIACLAVTFAAFAVMMCAFPPQRYSDFVACVEQTAAAKQSMHAGQPAPAEQTAAAERSTATQQTAFAQRAAAMAQAAFEAEAPTNPSPTASKSDADALPTGSLVVSPISTSEDGCITTSYAALADVPSGAPTTPTAFVSPTKQVSVSSTMPAVTPESENEPTAARAAATAPAAPAAHDDQAPAEGHAQTSEAPHAPRCRITFKEAADSVAEAVALSNRERDVLLLMIKGWSDQRIADELVVSYNTVRAHVRHIYTKADVHNREELLDLIAAAQVNSATAEVTRNTQTK